MFSLKPDYEKTHERFNAFWEREIIDRPPVNIILPGENRKVLPKRNIKMMKKDGWTWSSEP